MYHLAPRLPGGQTSLNHDTIRETRMKTEPRHVDKPWGNELIWADNELYVGKVLHIEEGEILSLQYHERKDETIHVLTGRIALTVGARADALEVVELPEGSGYRLEPGVVHRMEALETSDVLEASTPHLEDLVRLEDRYGRGRPEEGAGATPGD